MMAGWQFNQFKVTRVVGFGFGFGIIFGWVASLLLVAMVSGLTKRREE
jgi:hypothetical protein